jgi:hypothetical protein
MVDTRQQLAYIPAVIRSFKSKGLAELWEKGRTGKIDANMQARILRRLDRLDVIVRPEEMNVPGFDFHPLRVQTNALFGPREWAVVHHVRVRRR